MKFITPFYGVRAGEIYPEHFAPGDDCPEELQVAAVLTGAVEAPAGDEGADAAAMEAAGGKSGKKK